MEEWLIVFILIELKKIIDSDSKKVIYGGNIDEKDLYISPTIIDNVTEEDSCMKEEIFGPIIPIMTYNNIDEAIEFINYPKNIIREKPLGFYIFTKDSKIHEHVLEQTQSGGACVNDTMMQYNCPGSFGGIGSSGIGGGIHGKSTFSTFVHEKTVVINSTLLDPSIRYAPFTSSNVSQMIWLQKTNLNLKKIGIYLLILTLIFIFFKYLKISLK